MKVHCNISEIWSMLLKYSIGIRECSTADRWKFIQVRFSDGIVRKSLNLGEVRQMLGKLYIVYFTDDLNIMFSQTKTYDKYLTSKIRKSENIPQSQN